MSKAAATNVGAHIAGIKLCTMLRDAASRMSCPFGGNSDGGIHPATNGPLQWTDTAVSIAAESLGAVP